MSLLVKRQKYYLLAFRVKRFINKCGRLLLENGSWQGELWNKRKGNELYAEILSINAVKDKYGVVSNYIGIGSDITEKNGLMKKCIFSKL